MGGILTIHTSKFEDSTIKHRMATPPPLIALPCLIFCQVYENLAVSAKRRF